MPKYYELETEKEIDLIEKNIQKIDSSTRRDYGDISLES